MKQFRFVLIMLLFLFAVSFLMGYGAAERLLS